MVGIVDWRLAELDRLGVTIHYDTYAGADDVLAFEPDLVVIATGGIAQSPELETGEDLVVSSWDILAGAVKPEGPVLLFDDNGGHQGMSAAEVIATAAQTWRCLPERFFAPEMGGMNHVPYAKTFAEKNVRVTINTRLTGVRREATVSWPRSAPTFRMSGSKGASRRWSWNMARWPMRTSISS